MSKMSDMDKIREIKETLFNPNNKLPKNNRIGLFLAPLHCAINDGTYISIPKNGNNDEVIFLKYCKELFPKDHFIWNHIRITVVGEHFHGQKSHEVV